MQHIARVVMVMIGLQLSLVSSLWAFAVGDITVHSRRGEPFVADIRLLLEARERDKEIEVTLGNQDAYRGEGLKRLAVIDTLQAGLPPGARDVIRLSSTVPLQETAFDLVLLVRVGQVTIVKHYPWSYQPQRQLLSLAWPHCPPSRQSHPWPQPAKRSPKRGAPHSGRDAMGRLSAGRRSTALPKRCMCPNDKLWQAVVALWRANKGQFQGGNLHGLPVGTFLMMPSDLAEHMAAMPLSEAQEIVAEQWEEWRTAAALRAQQAACHCRGARYRYPSHRVHETRPRGHDGGKAQKPSRRQQRKLRRNQGQARQWCSRWRRLGIWSVWRSYKRCCKAWKSA